MIATLNFIIYLTITGKVLEMFQCSTEIAGKHYLNVDMYESNLLVNLYIIINISL